MQNQRPYVYGGRSFPSLRAIEQYLKPVIGFKQRILDARFFDDVLADVVVDRHYRWRQRGVRPVSFSFLENAAGDGRTWSDSLAGDFPGWGWQRFSYRKCLHTKDPTMEQEFERMCRERWSSRWRTPLLLRLGGRCAFPACEEAATDVDHVSMQHSEIVSRCWSILPEHEREAWWNALVHEDCTEHHFVLIEGHPVTEEYDRLTRAGTYQPLCKLHHYRTTSSRVIGSPTERRSR